MAVILNLPRVEDEDQHQQWQCGCGMRAFMVRSNGQLVCVNSSCHHETVGEPHQYGQWVPWVRPSQRFVKRRG